MKYELRIFFKRVEDGTDTDIFALLKQNSITLHRTETEPNRVDTYFDLSLDTVGLKHRSGKKLELKLRYHSVGHNEDWNKVYAHKVPSDTVTTADLQAAFAESTHPDAYKALQLLETGLDLATISVVVSKDRTIFQLHQNALFEGHNALQVEQTEVTITLPGSSAPEATKWRSICIEGSDIGTMPNVMDWLVSGWNAEGSKCLIMGYPQFIRHIRESVV